MNFLEARSSGLPPRSEPTFHVEFAAALVDKGDVPARAFENRGPIEVRVWDTTAETRFVVLPLQPEPTQGWPEDQLAEIVTRESMIGVALVASPG